MRAGTMVAVGGVVARAGTASAVPAPRFADDFSNARDGALGGRVSPTGHRWRAYGAGNDAPMTIYKRAIGPPAGHVPGASSGPGDNNPFAAAGYASIDLGGPAWRINAEYRWDRSPSANTGLAFGAFDFGPDSGSDFPALRGGSNAHLAITPTYLQFAVFSMGVLGDYTILTPRGASTNTIYFRTPQVRDGRVVYRAYITISGEFARIDLDGLSAPLVYQDPRIASVRASSPFWEYYSTPGGTNLPRFVRVSAQRAS